MRTMRYHDIAARWNETCPPGTPVLLHLADGRLLDDVTVGEAIGWGSVALVRLERRPGMWPTRILSPRVHDGRVVPVGSERVLLRPTADQSG